MKNYMCQRKIMTEAIRKLEEEMGGDCGGDKWGRRINCKGVKRAGKTKKRLG
jgi:hypothetical protein